MTEPGRPSGRIPCPGDLELTQGQRGALETGLVGRHHIDAVTLEYRSKYVGDTTELRTLEQWRRGLVSTISRSWNNPKERRMPSSETPAPVRAAPRIAEAAPVAKALVAMPDVLARVVKPRAAAPRSPVDASDDSRDAEGDLDAARASGGSADAGAVANG